MLNILIVDDMDFVHPSVESFLKIYVFEGIPFSITNSYNLTQAKRFLSEKQFGLVMLDGDVGNGWGYEIIPDILQHNSDVKIVSISNHDDFNLKNVEHGAHEAVNKINLYDWNDEKKEYRTQKGSLIRNLFVT